MRAGSPWRRNRKVWAGAKSPEPNYGKKITGNKKADLCVGFFVFCKEPDITSWRVLLQAQALQQVQLQEQKLVRPLQRLVLVREQAPLQEPVLGREPVLQICRKQSEIEPTELQPEQNFSFFLFH